MTINRNYIMAGIFSVIIIIALAISGSIFETVEKGTYHVKQAAFSGTMTAKTTPGMYFQNFGDITVWRNAETFYFTADDKEGDDTDQSIEVRFNDGSICAISGTIRVQLPRTESRVISLMTNFGYRSYEDMRIKLIRPVIRNALRLTANLMTARESYASKRPDFISWAQDQIQNGLYQTEDTVVVTKDPISDEKIKKTIKTIKIGKDGKPLRVKNPLEGMGIELSNFEVKSFVYSQKVREQIARQQEAYMAIATAKAEAQKAEQDKLKEEAMGKARVAKAKYEKEEEKIRAVVDAEKEKEVAVLSAEKSKKVEELSKEAAFFTKQKEILLGQGEAERKKLVMKADGALKQKLDAYVKVMEVFAREFGKQKWVPEVQMGVSKANGSAAVDLMNLLSVKAAKDLSLNMKTSK